jgi:Cu(I)/Ag(I) efflux system membrane fusion protein
MQVFNLNRERLMKKLMLVIALLVIPVFSVYSAMQSPKHNHTMEERHHAVTYSCPMHSHIVKDHPGKCPICGMDLVEKAMSQPESEVSISISGHTQQSMALTTDPVVRSTLWRFIETFGKVEYDENGLTHIHPRATGWVENLKVKTLGAAVKKGELLYEIYAPELIVAQDDYLSLLKTNPANKSLKERGRTRLRLLGMSDRDKSTQDKSPEDMPAESTKSMHEHHH